MATLCISTLSPGMAQRQRRLLDLMQGLIERGEKVDVLFYGSGIYSLVAGSKTATALADSGIQLFALADDIESRGLSGRLIPQAEQVDYEKVVDMVMGADRTITGI